MHTRACHRPAGFTLLELLMVILVVGILSSVVLLNINLGGPERQLPEEAERLSALLALASDEAVMENREYGVKVEARGYVFLCLNEETQHWVPCPGRQFSAYTLPDGLSLRLVTESALRLPRRPNVERPLTGSDAEEDKSTARIEPDILLLSSGEATPVELELRLVDDPSRRLGLRLDDIGRVHADALPGAGT